MNESELRTTTLEGLRDVQEGSEAALAAVEKLTRLPLHPALRLSLLQIDRELRTASRSARLLPEHLSGFFPGDPPRPRV